MAQNIIQLQYPQQQRIPAMSLIQANPVPGQGIPIEHQQRLPQNQFLQGQYFYGGRTQPVMGVMYNPPSWYPNQDQLHQQYHVQNQLWYGMPLVNGPQVFRPKPPSYNQHPNGAQKQTGQFSCPLKPAIKTRSRPILKNHTQSSSTNGRTLAGGRSYSTRKTSADCCLNRIRSISSIQNKGSPIQDSKQCTDDNILKEAVSKESVKSQEEIIQKKNEEKQVTKIVMEEIHIEKVEEASLANESSGLFRRLARFMRFRFAGKSKNRKKENVANAVVTQAYSCCPSAKRH